MNDISLSKAYLLRYLKIETRNCVNLTIFCEKMKKIIIGGNGNLLRDDLTKQFESDSFSIKEVSRPGEVFESVMCEKFDAVVYSFRFDEVDSTQAFFAMKIVDKKLPVIIIADINDKLATIPPVLREAFRYYRAPVNYIKVKEAINEAVMVNRHN